MKIFCNIITKEIREIAKELNKSEGYTCNLISAWQTTNINLFTPTIQELKEFIKENKEKSLEAYFAIPFYKSVEYKEGGVPIENNNGSIILMKLPKDNPMEYFYNMYKHIPELRNMNLTILDAYKFTLWREMAFIQYGLDKKNQNRDFAESEALKKLKELKKRQNMASSDSGATTTNTTDTTTPVRTKRSLGDVSAQDKEAALAEIEKLKQEKEAKENAVNNNVVITPTIGTEIININYNNPYVKIAKEMSPIERQSRVIMLSRMFSDIVDEELETKLQETQDLLEEEQAKEEPNEGEIQRLKDKIADYNNSVSGRKTVIRDITTKAIFDRMKQTIQEYAELGEEYYDEEYGKGNGVKMISAYNRILEHWNVLLEEACEKLEYSENMRIVVDKVAYNDGNKITRELAGTINEVDNQNDANDEDNENGEEQLSNQGMSFKIRFVDPVTSISKDVKKVLSNIYKLDINGETATDDLGNMQHLDAEYVHAVLLNGMSEMVNPDDFVYMKNGEYVFPALDKLSEKYNWVSQIINTLQADPSLISAFYTDLRKDHIHYWAQFYDRDGNVKTVQLNAPIAMKGTFDSIITNYEKRNVLDEDSIYNSKGELRPEVSKTGLELVSDTISELDNLNDDNFDTVCEKTSKILNMIGLYCRPQIVRNLIKSNDGIDDLYTVLNSCRSIFDGLKDIDINTYPIDAFSQDYKIIADKMGIVSELDAVQSFRNNNKTYYSYSAPNYVDTMFKYFKDNDKRDNYINTQFRQYAWFYDKDKEEWNSEWLNLIENNENVRDQMEQKELLSIAGLEYKDWTPSIIKVGFITEYFSAGYNSNSTEQYAWYNMPIFSDSPVVKFIKFLRYTDDKKAEGKTFQDKLIPLFRKVVLQELSRIKLVQEREKLGIQGIANFDGERGKQFCFFPELNNTGFLEECIRLKNIGEEDALRDYIDVKMLELLNSLFDDFYNNLEYEDLTSNIPNMLEGQGIKLDNKDEQVRIEQVRHALEEYFWNQAYATTQIIQLTTTDLAYYKDDTDFQKRYKEVYAAGNKLNTNSPNYGRKTERTLYLKDKVITSARYQSVKRILERAQAEGRLQSYDVDNILDKFKDINVADAQAYRSISSYRAILDMLGKWTPEMQKAMENFYNQKWDMKDFGIIWQTLKPFMFTNTSKPDGLGGNIRVPHQNKNSEFLLMALYDALSIGVGASPVLRGINRFMEDNNIDVIQFESAVKAGGQGTIDISYSPSKLDTWIINNEKSWQNMEKIFSDTTKKDAATASKFTIFKTGLDYMLENGEISQDNYNKSFEYIEPSEQEVYDMLENNTKSNREFKSEVLHELSYDDYVIQQPTPEHLLDTQAIFGSQFRNLIVADMPDDPNFRITVNGVQYTKEEILNLYNSLIVENLLESYNEMTDRFGTIENLQEALLNIVKANNSYGRDLIDALQIVEVEVNGVKKKTFNIPLDSPTIVNKVQQLVTSMFKNVVTKQKIKGGNCILVSDFGLTKELQINYTKDGGIESIDCYLPAYSKTFFEPFMKTKPNGSMYLDFDNMPEELKRCVGYRIPTEDKYSMVPLKIKGFLPQQNGSTIMLPADITQIAGSDFDVDKLFLMLPEFIKTDKYNIKEAWKSFYQSHPDIVAKIDEAQWNEFRASYENLLQTDPEQAKDIDVEDEEFKNWFVKESGKKTYEWVDGVRGEFKKWFNINKEQFFESSEIKKVEYDITKTPQEQSREARNNMLLDISYSILQHPDTAEKILNPGNFDKVKLSARVALILNDFDLMTKYAITYGVIKKEEEMFNKATIEKIASAILKDLSESNLSKLNKFIKDTKKEKSQLSVDTFAYYHEQNMTGGALIGIYANNTTMQAKYQTSALALKDDYTFTFDGVTYKSLHDIYNAYGERISKNCANFSAASVDNVKDPVLADLLQNKDTASITGFMLRVGMPISTIGLLFSHPLVRSVLKEEGPQGFSRRIKVLLELAEKEGITIDNTDFRPQLMNLTSEEITVSSIMYTINDEKGKKYLDLDSVEEDEEEEEKVKREEEKKLRLLSYIRIMSFMQHMTTIAEDLNNLTQISRADSPNGAIANTIGGAISQVRKVEMLQRSTYKKSYSLYGVSDSVQNEYVNYSSNINTLRDKLLRRNMARLQAFYSLGIELPLKMLSPYFSTTSDYVNSLLEDIQDNSNLGQLSTNMIDNFQSEFINFVLSSTKTFGDDGHETFMQKRDYYLYDYPKEFITIISENEDIAKIPIIEKMTVENGNIIMKDSGKMTQTRKTLRMRDLDQLLFSDNPKAQKLAKDLFMYSYYKDGLKFGPNNFGTFFSSNFLSCFPEVINTLRNLSTNAGKDDWYKRFIDQYYANNIFDVSPRIYEGETDKKEVYQLAGGALSIASKKVINRNLNEGDYDFYKYITFIDSNGTLNYYKLSTAGANSAVYVPFTAFSEEHIDYEKQNFLYNANMELDELLKYRTDPNKKVANQVWQTIENPSDDKIFGESQKTPEASIDKNREINTEGPVMASDYEDDDSFFPFPCNNKK